MSVISDELEKTYKEYEDDWCFIDEAKNPKEGPIMEWIATDKYAEVHQELRPIVDEFMRYRSPYLSALS